MSLTNSVSDANDIVIEMMAFHKLEEIRDIPPDPLTTRLGDLIRQALETNEALVEYLADTEQEARSISLSTVHFYKNSLGLSRLY
jgi:hypothetical protein